MQYTSGIMYGAFDPPTALHMAFAQEAVNILKLESISFRLLSEAETGKPLQAPEADRSEMLRLASFHALPVSNQKSRLHLFAESEISVLLLQKLFPDGLSEEDLVVLLSENGVPENTVVRCFLSGSGAGLRFLSVPSPADDMLPQVREYIREMGLYGCKPSPVQAAQIYPVLRNALPEKRFFHSLLVASTARQLAEKYGVDPDDAALSGLIHDCAKALPLPQMQQIALDVVLPVDEATLANDNLLHGPVGSVLAKSQYGIQNEEILSAVFCHTTGKPGMSTLEMILFLADKIEPSRKPYPALETIRSLARANLKEAVLVSLRSTMDHVSATQSEPPHPMTQRVCEWVQNELKNERK